MLRLSTLATALAAVGAIGLGALPAAPAFAGPTGGSVVAGTASIRTNGTQTDIVQTSRRAVIDWRQFSIGNGESVHFRQPDAGSSTLNRVTGADPSRILGTITATGQVLILNPNGVLFGPAARVDTAGLVVSTARLATDNFMAGGRLSFTASDQAGGSIVNQGAITVREGGLAALVAPHVRNEGLIRADLGRVMLASGSSFAIDLASDGLLSLALRESDLQELRDAQGGNVAALIENTGSLIAASGQVVLVTPAFASKLIDNAIHLGGVVRADTVGRDAAGAIVLKAAQGRVQLNGEIAAPGGTFTMERDLALVSLDADTAGAVSRALRNGTSVDISATGRIDLASRIDGRGDAAGASLRLRGASVGLRDDIYTQDGAVSASASAGATEMLRTTSEIVPGRSWPVIMTGLGDIRLEASGAVQASHLVTRGHVHVASSGGNVNLVASLGGDLGGTSPLASLTVRALGQPDARDVGNVSELHDVNVAPGGRIDIAATRNIQVFATGTGRPGLNAARNGEQGRSLRLASDRLGAGDLARNTFYWTGLNSRARHVGRGTSPEDAAGRWTNLQATTKEAGNPTAGAPPGPTNVLASAPVGGSGLTLLWPAPAAAFIADVLPGASTVVASGGSESDTGSMGIAALSVNDDGYSASRGIAQAADTGRAPSTAAPKDIFSLADHVVEVPACATPVFVGQSYFVRGVFGQPLNIACR